MPAIPASSNRSSSIVVAAPRACNCCATSKPMAPISGHAEGLRPLRQLTDQPSLAHAPLAEQRHHPPAVVGHRAKHLVEAHALAVTVDDHGAVHLRHEKELRDTTDQ